MTVQAFTYHRSIAPMMWVLVALASVELLVTHLVLAHWWPRTALAISLVSLAGVAWLVLGIRSFARRPVAIEPDRLVMRVGWIKSVVVPLTAVAGLREDWTAESLRGRSVLNLALIAYPNVLVALDPPMTTRRGRRITAIAHRLDDPAGFVRALAGVGRRDD